MTRKALGRGLSALIREVEALPPVGVAGPSIEPAGAPAGERAEPPGLPVDSSAESAGRAEAWLSPASSAGATGGATADPGAGLHQIPVDLIERNPFQPRRAFPMESLQELAASIRSTGLLQPVLVRPAAKHYELVAGERRWQAAMLAGLDAIPALVRPLSDQESLELALTENLLREDLNALEIAQAYHTLQSQFDLTQEQIAERLGVSRTMVANTVRLLRLPELVQRMVVDGDLTAGHARAILALDSAGAQEAMAKVIKLKNLSVRAVEHMIVRRRDTLQKSEKSAQTIDANVRAAAHELERTLGTRVKITGNGRRGKIEISYFSAEDLNRIYELIAEKSQ